jgi:hypothetical protein
MDSAAQPADPDSVSVSLAADESQPELPEANSSPTLRRLGGTRQNAAAGIRQTYLALRLRSAGALPRLVF